MRKLTDAQLRKIHVAAKELGMDDDLLHEYVSMMTEKDSLKELTVMEAVRVIDGLMAKLGYARGDQVSCRQKGYIAQLMKKAGWVDENGEPDKKRLDGFVRKNYGIDDSIWMTRGIASKVIEALKSFAYRTGQQA